MQSLSKRLLSLNDNFGYTMHVSFVSDFYSKCEGNRISVSVLKDVSGTLCRCVWDRLVQLITQDSLVSLNYVPLVYCSMEFLSD